jgi:hypothetical protein
MTNAVAAVPNAAAPQDTKRTSSARAASTSFAEVQAAAVKDSTDKDTTTSSSSKTTTDSASASDAPKGEKTQKVKGHNYVEIVAGPRNGMFINNTGSKRDGEAFLIVKRHGREFHVYGTGDDRTVYEVGRKRETTTDSGSTTSGSTTSGSTTEGASTTGTTGASATTSTT